MIIDHSVQLHVYVSLDSVSHSRDQKRDHFLKSHVGGQLTWIFGRVWCMCQPVLSLSSGGSFYFNLGNAWLSFAGDGCVDKPLATLWKNHTTTDKPNIMMKVTVCASGLKAVTKEHGLTEYWAHRITFCEAEPSYPKVFCWIYR